MTNETLRLRTSSEEATAALGRELGTALAPGITVLLYGDLGAGKTTLVRGVGEALGVARVRSPSFTLVNEYRTAVLGTAGLPVADLPIAGLPGADLSIAGLPVVHADLYRLEPGGVEDLGLEEYHETPCVLLVEWPDRWENHPERDVLKIFIEAVNENERIFDVSSLGGAADLVLQNLREAVKDGKSNPGAGLQPALD